MTPTIEERLAAYRDVLDAAIDARIHDVRPKGAGRRWWLLAPLLGAVAAAAIGLVLVVRDLDATGVPGPADTAVVPSDQTSAPAVVTTAASLPPSASPFPTSTVAVAVAPGATTSPDAARAAFAIGDSVMLGAASQLMAADVTVDALASRHFSGVVDVVHNLAVADLLGDAVVIHAGNNGTISDADIEELFATLSDVPTVVVLTLHIPRDYAAANNARLTELPARFPNVTVIPWDTLADTCPGNCFYDDGIHLRPDGRTFYADIIEQALASSAP